MATTVRVPVNGQVLRKARQDARLTVSDLARKIGVKAESIENWERSDGGPTLNQLREVGRQLRLTPATFLLDEVPADSSPTVPDFRGNGTAKVDQVMAKEFSKAEDRRKVMLELAGATDALAGLSWENGDSPSDTASKFHDALELDFRGALRALRSDSDALAFWIEVLNDLGVLVFQMSRVDKREVLGASVSHESVPMILLNGATKPSVRVFTLWHEVGHLLSHTGGVCSIWTPASAEARCNEFAAEFLMPTEVFKAELGDDDPVAALERLSRHFKVSQSAVAVRLKTMGYLSDGQLKEQLRIAENLAKRAEEAEESKKKTGGPPHHRVHLRNIGAQYFDTVTDALDAGRISLLDASYYLEAKVPTIDRMLEERVTKREVLNEVLA